jgi:tripartite-type tricarboxylate transporter receptor subunit TctC
VQAVLAEPAVQARLMALGAQVRGGTAEEFGAVTAAELAKWTAVIRSAGLTADP